MNPLKRLARYLLVERPAAKKTLAAWGDKLQADGDALIEKLSDYGDSDDNRRVLSHIVGIERWGQSRLKVALGEPFKKEEYDDYRPPKNRTWDQLKAEFKAARRQTIALARRMDRGEVEDYSIKILHNSYGELTLAGWLRYLNIHANLEAKRLK